MTDILQALLALALVMAFMTLALEGGVFWRRQHPKNESDASIEGLGAVDGAIFGLMGLLLAFAFSGAASRFDERRDLIVEEANCIGTAYLRLDLLDVKDQPALRQLFRDYLEERLATYDVAESEEQFMAGLKKSNVIQSQIWARAVAAEKRMPTTVPGMLMVPALNEMFDIVLTRTSATLTHPPAIVFWLLGVVLLISSALAGYRMGESKRWGLFHKICFVIILSVTFYVILDFEYPRMGLIRVDDFDQVLMSLRSQIG